MCRQLCEYACGCAPHLGLYNTQMALGLLMGSHKLSSLRRKMHFSPQPLYRILRTRSRSCSARRCEEDGSGIRRIGAELGECVRDHAVVVVVMLHMVSNTRVIGRLLSEYIDFRIMNE
jgi:hypothetical protein